MNCIVNTSSRTRVVRAAVAAAIGSSLASAALAHDFWLEPSDYTPDAGAMIGVRILIGHGGEAEPYARNPQRIVSFVAVEPGERGRTKQVGGATGDEPAGQALLSEPGVWVIGYRSNHARSELEAAKFESYLREEGLEEIVERRKAEGLSEKRGTEVYSRCAKSLVRVRASGGAASYDPDASAERPLGFTLELVPVGDPTVASIGQSQRFRLLFNGEAYAGAKVEFIGPHQEDVGANESAAHEHVSARTDASGEVSFTIDRPGQWIVHSVVMDEAPESTGADWESWWASLTFEVAGR